ncbi:MAG: galactokinase [Candidatus Raymondbacteria bacterium RifOxyC12_full_50_8]|uniref:Galactokinase n=1 Tax=Candidatus Raymondbacteria bacterium RIFOXYD12_FULL_49_13 TaxID=1817890 RepID=A0A1F7FHW0_UNCRA|nr:MAG: galactokinase [Candidatus Raymondbacteria bacterium RIFOXYA2_FULL_49_16]OGJ95690.1 MAG: galactokinase [Candidatus Raymondbacteria bacterium RifOxyB12_full_50_8]OGK05947.1 MAG: galactokinase [Candidatus Raymondbacteria bacterium RifOxyC12_full_50_8]OGK06305.1 MAG: galactokinase [Candidatus Raymondbacteria bacterium RIFOXYD12_FULL_49_13]OGP40638.1 MAG: galactokinase [Candidatus Raymondbacteria bacterium RIFOXYB2_FULL_49_35]
MKTKLVRNHQQKFHFPPAFCVFAPGRINFIGEHTDYNGGLVMPMALDKGVYVAISPNGDRMLRIQSLDFNQYAEFSLEGLAPDPSAMWANCPKGIVRMLQDKGCAVPGADITITGDLPIGAGLSSSAAVEVAVGFAVKRMFNLNVSDIDLAFLCQKAEHEFTGAKCGIMDQMISILGKKRTLMKLSCADLEYEYIPFKFSGVSILITNSRVSHNLAQGEYNVRRTECAQIFEMIRTMNSDAATISDFSLKEMGENEYFFRGTLYNRLLHILSENYRVRKMARMLKDGDLYAVGDLLYESHKSMRDHYEVSCPELDWLVDNASQIPGVYGARMTGGGFGGCTITLLKQSAEKAYIASLDQYVKEFGIEPEVYTAVPSDGVRVI